MTVDGLDLDTPAGTPEHLEEQGGIAAVQLKQFQFVLFAQQGVGEPGRARVVAQRTVWIELLYEVAVIGQCGGQIVALPESPYAVTIFGQLGGIAAVECVTSGSGMGVDVPVRGVFLVQVADELNEEYVFQYVGMVAGVKGMTVAEHFPGTCGGAAWCGDGQFNAFVHLLQATLGNMA